MFTCLLILGLYSNFYSKFTPSSVRLTTHYYQSKLEPDRMSLIIIGLSAIALIAFLPKIFAFFLDIHHLIKIGYGLPGPRALPIIGNSLQIGPLQSHERMTFLVKESNELTAKGEGMMRIWILNKLYIFPLDGNTVKSLMDSNEEITKGDDYAFLLPWLGNGLLLSTSDKWKSRRKMLTPTFHFSMLDGYTSVFNEECKILVSILEKYSKNEEELDIFPYVKRCALDIICSTAMGESVSAQTDPSHPYVLAVGTMSLLAVDYALKPHLWFPPIWHLGGYAKSYRESLTTLLDFTKKVIKERQEAVGKGEFREEGRKAFLDMLLEMNSDGQLTDEDIREEVDTFMFEGHDTTSSGIGWILWCFACHPDIQERVYDEIQQVFGDSDRDATSEDMNSLTYFNRCIKEAMRMHPPVPLIQRQMQNDFQLGKYLIPKGSQVVIPPLLIHHNHKLYPNSNKFDPDRFLAENSTNRHSYDYMPFSAGPRNCIGQKFAMLEERIMVSWILRRYRLTASLPFLDNPRCPDVVLRPHKGIPVILHSRQ